LWCTNSSSNGTVAASTTGAIPLGFRVGTVTPGFSAVQRHGPHRHHRGVPAFGA
jgi:hypothetical protein